MNITTQNRVYKYWTLARLSQEKQSRQDRYKFHRVSWRSRGILLYNKTCVTWIIHDNSAVLVVSIYRSGKVHVQRWHRAHCNLFNVLNSFISSQNPFSCKQMNWWLIIFECLLTRVALMLAIADIWAELPLTAFLPNTSTFYRFLANQPFFSFFLFPTMMHNVHLTYNNQVSVGTWRRKFVGLVLTQRPVYFLE